jgi:hypothetical protein
MRCEHCYYQFGVTDTRCRNCGCPPSRVRVSAVTIVCLVLGLGIGWSIERMIRTDVSRAQRWHHAHGAREQAREQAQQRGQQQEQQQQAGAATMPCVVRG